MAQSHSKRRRLILLLMCVLLPGYVLLLIPESEAPMDAAVAKPAQSRPFLWNQDAFWHALETEFEAARRSGCEGTQPRLEAEFGRAGTILRDLAGRNVAPENPVLRELETSIFQLAPRIAACPARLSEFSELVTRMRLELKRQSMRWDMADLHTRTTLYRLLYGGRAAMEEVLLQVSQAHSPAPLVVGKEEPSRTPWAGILGIKIHSGDILISRGGFATSSLIARGNDFAGNFSHIALVYVNPKTHLASIIEAHIEKGVGISTLEEYLHDVKLRVMVLRLRSDLPPLVSDPMLPHRAAESALTRAQREHIPYDFAMDIGDSGKLFCSEVASAAYRPYGINLWMNLSQISSQGLRRWLAGFGVRSFVTQEPSDLEYDPQLQIVAEWRDLDVLRKDHIDNAVTEALLDGANAGEPLLYDRYLLPVARLMKFLSLMMNQAGCVGPVPEGMSATAALRNRWFTRRHAAIYAAVTEQAGRFEKERGYTPPYWRLVEMARQAKEQL